MTTAGAYGFRFSGLAPTPALAVTGAQGWPTIDVTRASASDPAEAVGTVGESEATIVTPVGVLGLDRARRTLTIASHTTPSEADIVHPGLWPAAAVFARWGGAETLHAGAFVAPGQRRAWAVMAESGGGKSSFLAALARVGGEVLVDDLVVVKGGHCLAGPRCIDLRADVVSRLDLGENDTVPVRSTSRRRLALSPCEARRPIDGFVELCWGDAMRIDRLSPAEGLAALARHRRVVGLGAEFDQLLELLERPMLRLTRPHGWDSVTPAIEALLDAIARTR